MIKTKKSLWAAGLALLISIALLIATTFAWFTDSVTNNGNRIQAGNLEVDLLMDKSSNGTYTSIANGTGDIFSTSGDGANWEPGMTKIVYLAVQNKGSLALNYNIILDVKDGNPGLVGSLDYAILDGKKASDISSAKSWNDIKAIEGVQTGQVAEGKVTAAPNGTLDEIVNGTANETDYFAFAVHMNENAGNEYQGGSVAIDVNVVAKQATAEKDGFGDINYDIDADYYTNVGDADSFIKEIQNLQPNEMIRLTDDITLDSSLPLSESGTTNIDLNNNTLTIDENASSTVNIDNNNQVTIQNGHLNLKVNNITKALFKVSSGGTFNLHDVTYKTTGTAVLITPTGDAAKVNISDSNITADGYCVSTNASEVENKDIEVNIRDSVLTALDGEGKAGTAVLFNVPGKLNMTNCTVESAWQSVIVRGGKAVIENCTMTNTYMDGKYLNYYEDRWSTGNGVNLAVITIGNKGTGYQYPSDVTIDNSTLKSVGPYPAIYINGNTGDGLGATLTYDDATTISGDVIAGNNACSINGQQGPINNN